MEKFVITVQKNRWSVILACLVAVAVFLFGATRLQFSGDYKVFFDHDNPYLIAFDKHQNTFDKTDNLLLAVEFKEGSVFDKNNLSLLEDLTEELWQVPYATRVDSIVNFQRIQSVGDDISVIPTVSDAESLSIAQINEIRDFVNNEPALKDRLITEKGNLTAFFITQNFPPNPTEQKVETTNYARDLEKRYEAKYPNLDIHVSGLTALNGAFVEATLSDLVKLTPLMLLAILLIIAAVLRSLAGAIASFFLVTFSAFGALGIAGWLGIPLSPPSLASLNIILILCIASTVHVLANFYQGFNSGEGKSRAMQVSLKLNFIPLFLTSFTTVVGFLSLNFSDAPPYRHLGNIVSIGITLAFIFTFTLLPAFMSFIKDSDKGKTKQMSFIGERFGRFVIKNRVPLLILLVSAGVAGAYLAPKNEISDNYSEYFDHSIPFRNANDAIAGHLPALYSIEFELKSKGENGITDPEYLANVERFSKWLGEQEYVANVLSFSDTMKRLNKSMNGDQEDFYRIPDDKVLASQYLLLYELSLPFGLDLNSQISVDRSSTRLVGSLYNLPTKATLKLEKEANSWIRNNLPEYMWVNATSPSVMFCHIALQNIVAGIEGGIFALLLISLVIMIALKSFRLGVISIIPNIIPVVIAFGFWAVYKGNVGLSLSLSVGITLGIVVDDTVHFITKYKYAREKLMLDVEEAIIYTYKMVGDAIWLTSVALMVGFAIIGNSSFAQNSDLGIFVVFTVFVALIYDLFLLPIILFYADRAKPVSSAVTAEAEA